MAEFLWVQCLERQPSRGCRLTLDMQLTCLLLPNANLFPSSASICGSWLPRVVRQDLFQGNNLEYVNSPTFQPHSAYTAFKPYRHTLHCIQWEWRVLQYSFHAVLFDLYSEKTLVNSSLNAGKRVCCGNLRKPRGFFPLGCLIPCICCNWNTILVLILL